MGRTIPPFRIAAEMERAKWRDFRSILINEDRKLFDEMFSYSRSYNSACMLQSKPIVFYSVMISILFVSSLQATDGIMNQERESIARGVVVMQVSNSSVAVQIGKLDLSRNGYLV